MPHKLAIDFHHAHVTQSALPLHALKIDLRLLSSIRQYYPFVEGKTVRLTGKVLKVSRNL